MFTCAKQWNILKENPVAKARPEEFKQKNKKKSIVIKERCLTVDESKRLLAELSKEHIKYQIIVQLAIVLGLRRSEILGIKWSDLDLENRILFLNQSSIYVCGAGYFESDLKTEPSYRGLALPKITTYLLKKYKKISMEYSKEPEFVFISNRNVRKGYRMNPSSLTNWFCAFRKKINLPSEVPLQGLRHTNATLLLIRGFDVKSVSTRLGHSNTETTLDIYSEALPETDKTTSETMDKVLFQRDKIPKENITQHKRKLSLRKKERTLV